MRMEKNSHNSVLLRQNTVQDFTYNAECTQFTEIILIQIVVV